MEALLLYARATDQLRAGRRLEAVGLLEKAVALDPGSFELHYELGRAYAREGNTPDSRALAALRRAVELRPDHLRAQVDLGRVYLAGGEDEKGLWHLRLALKTTEYDRDEAGSAVAELLLGRALAREGYHAAAVEVYERLAARLDSPGMALRSHPETAFLIMRPELLRLQAAESYERIGRFDAALRAYEAASARDPGSLDLRARVVKALAALRRFDEATAKAAEAVARFRASPASLALLKEAGGGRDGGLAEELRRLRRERPKLRALAFALADVLAAEGKRDEARGVLREAAAAAPADPEAVRRLYELERDAGADGAAAARFLVEWSALHPDAVHLLGDHWDDLLRAVGTRRFGLAALRGLEPPEAPHPRWAAAKDFWVAHVARLRHRRDVARAALRRSAEARPVFSPAPRAYAGWDQGELGLTPDERARAVEGLAESLGRDPGQAALAAELRGLLLLTARDFARARDELSRAVKLDGASPERRFALAVAARGAGDESAFESAMWKIVSDWPGFDDAYDALYALYEGREDSGASSKVLSAWLAADPAGVAARLVQTREHVQAGRVTAAQSLVQRLFVERPGDARVLGALRAMFGQGRAALWLRTELQQRHAAAPGELATAAQLVDLLADDGKAAEATRVLDTTRAAVAADADLLYQVAHLYGRVGQKATTEAVLREALALEPNHAPAANDLGYSLAEDGRDLEHAEALARLAVAAEPGNASFLDSLGWVLYKRGRFDEARQHLERSIGADAGGGAADAPGGDETGAGPGAPAADDGPDAVVLDHLGDTLYRQGNAEAAGAQWDRAARRILAMPPEERDRDDLKQLRLQLERKRKQLEAGQPVSVSPVAEQPPRAVRSGE